MQGAPSPAGPRRDCRDSRRVGHAPAAATGWSAAPPAALGAGGICSAGSFIATSAAGGAVLCLFWKPCCPLAGGTAPRVPRVSLMAPENRWEGLSQPSASLRANLASKTLVPAGPTELAHLQARLTRACGPKDLGRCIRSQLPHANRAGITSHPAAGPGAHPGRNVSRGSIGVLRWRHRAARRSVKSPPPAACAPRASPPAHGPGGARPGLAAPRGFRARSAHGAPV
jgi:hypothetical protein